MKRAIILTFHGLNGDRTSPDDHSDPTSQRYFIKTGVFEEILKVVHTASHRRNVYLKDSGHDDVLVITFDDGFMSDYEIALPMLIDRGLSATFFITARNVGRPGYLEKSHVREMISAGMEIGSHGLTHSYLTTMSRAEAVGEICESKERLEQDFGSTVRSFAAAGGHYHAWMFDVAQEAGYHSFATMIPGITRCGEGFSILKRNHIQAQHSVKYAQRIIRGDIAPMLMSRFIYEFLRIPKKVLGMKRYDILRDAFMHLYRIR